MTGKEYVELRRRFIEAAAWFILQSDTAKRSLDERENLVGKTLTYLGTELREEVEEQTAAATSVVEGAP